MFVFDNVITAGTVLVRDQIESQNWTPSAGTLGWAIKSNGDASFNNADIRGTLVTGSAPTGPGLIIDNKAPVGLAPGYGRIRLYSGAVAETAPAELAALADQFGRTRLNLSSNNMGFGTIQLGLNTAESALSHGLIQLQNFLTNGQPLDFDIDGQLSASLQPYGIITDGTTRSTASAAFTGIAGQATQLTMTAPRSNRILLLWWALTNNATANAGTIMSAEVRDGSLIAPVLDAASDIGAVRNNNTGNAGGMGFRYVDLSANPPTAGQIYTRCMFRTTAGTGNFVQSALAVIGLP